MASTVQLKRSAIPGTPPTTAQLNLGELAINTYDGKLYLKKNVTGTESIVEVGSGTSSTSITTGTATIDFGAYPGSNEASVTVTGQSLITANSIVAIEVLSNSTSIDHSANDHVYFTTFASLTNSSPIAGTGFTISARSHQKLTGKWTLNWSWI